MTKDLKIPEPLKGKPTIFKVDGKMHVQMNAEGWVEEIGYGSRDDGGSTRLKGIPGTISDDLFADRYYDLFARIVLVDIRSKRSSGYVGRAYGSIRFKDLEKGSPLYERVNMAIAISNHYFGTELKPIS